MIRNRWDVAVPLRDGVELAADLYLPERDEPAPTLLMRTPYDKQTALYAKEARFYAEHGYAVVLQDVRGRHESGGEWIPFRNEGPDGSDTIEWAAAQPWSNGRIGTFGGSYGGWFQWAAARERPPHLTTMVSTAAGGRWMQEGPYDNGTLLLVMLGWLNLTAGRTMKDPAHVDWERVLRHLPLRELPDVLGRELPMWHEYLDHPTLDDYWKAIRLSEEDFAAIDLPALHISGWYDGDQPGALFFYEGMRAHSPARERQAIRLGPWDHGGTREPRQELGGVDFSPRALLDMQQLHLEWFDHWLKGEGESPLARKRADYFLSGINEWREASSWPPDGVAERALHLRSQGRANTFMGDGALSAEAPVSEPADEYVYNPQNPVVATPDFDFYSPDGAEPPLDRRYITRRDDVLVYSGDPLAEPLTIAGRPEVVLFGSSDCPDTDWFATLEDVHPDGRSILLANGRLRARFRESLEYERLLRPGETYEFRFELMSVGHVFAAGHRVRLTVTSSDFPIYDRNLNTGGSIADGSEWRIARNRIHHSAATPSRLLLPVVSG